LEKAKELGDFLIVGVHDDATVNFYKGQNYPIQSLHERVLNVLAMRAVDEVVMGAPWIITRDLLTSMNISIVVAGTIIKGDRDAINWRKGSMGVTDEDPYAVPKEMGIFLEVESPITMDTNDIIKRIVDQRLHFMSKYQRTSTREAQYYTQQKQFVEES
jgi:ethanolamine-phosphate cytidylyltransferase